MAKHKRLILVSCFCFFINCLYIAKQSACFLSHQLNAKPIEQLLKSDTLDAEKKHFFTLVNLIRSFAVDSIGLNHNRNYISYVELNKNYLVDVVCAAQETSFVQYKWWYPFVGTVPYKGFFERKDALREAQRLKKKGYDVYIGAVDAFSTLGYFSDPLYSFMKGYSVFRLTSTIIHEQTHATIYSVNNSQFNEEAATFIGNYGALWFIRSHFGDTSQIYSQALMEYKDDSVFTSFLRSVYMELDSIYNKPIGKDEKLRLKNQVINRRVSELDSNKTSIFLTYRYQNMGRLELNNAYLAIAMTYGLDLEDYIKLFVKNGYDLRKTVSQLKQIQKEKGRHRDYIKRLIAEKQMVE